MPPGAAVRFEGQVMVLGRGACYACVYPEIADHAMFA